MGTCRTLQSRLCNVGVLAPPLFERRRVWVASGALFVLDYVLQPDRHRHDCQPAVGKRSTTRVRRRISQFSRSMALLALFLVQCRNGDFMYADVSPQPSRAIFTAAAKASSRQENQPPSRPWSRTPGEIPGRVSP